LANGAEGAYVAAGVEISYPPMRGAANLYEYVMIVEGFDPREVNFAGER
jgi:hypothetical protein